MALRRIFSCSFLFQIFPHLFKKPKDKWVDCTFTKPKGKSFMEFALSLKYSRKCNRFSNVIMNKLHDWRSHWQTWTEVMYKARQTFCLDLFLLFVRLFCDVMQITSWKQKVPCIMRISILEAKFVRKSAHYYTRINTVFCFVLFCLVSSAIGADLYTTFQK